MLADRRRAWTGVAAVGTVGAAAAELVTPAATARAVDAAVAGSGVPAALVLLAGVLAGGALAAGVALVATSAAGTAATAAMRRDVVERIVAAGVRHPGRRPSGELLTRLLVDTEQAGAAGPTLVTIGAGAAVTAGAVLALGTIDPLAAVVPVTAAVLAVGAARRAVTRIGSCYAEYQQRLGGIAARLTDAMAGARTIRACGTERREARRVLQPLPALARAGAALWQAQRVLVWRMTLLLAVVELAVLGLVGARLAAGQVSAGEYLAAVGYTALVLRLRVQLDAALNYPQVRAAARRVRELLGGPAPDPGPAGVGLPAGPGALRFRGVSVRVGDRLVLDRLDLDVPAGRCVAVVGPSGAGKSTLTGLLGRLVEAEHGEVSIDGVPVTAVDRALLRREVAYAFERPELRGGTIRDAVAAGRPGATAGEVAAALRVAGAEQFVRHLPGGVDEPLAPGRLSGGERQRLGLARAVAHGGRVLVLDDATSSLDTATEARVAAALTARLAGRTRLVVAHRAGTAARADLVAWLDRGRIRALAPHAQLWGNEPEYRALFAVGRAAP